VHLSGRRGTQAKKADHDHTRQWKTSEQILYACLEFSGNDTDALQPAYNVYAKEIVDRTIVVPG